MSVDRYVMRVLRVAVLSAVAVVTLAVIGWGYVFCTSAGARLCALYALDHAVSAQSYAIERIDGTLVRGIAFHQLVIKNFQRFPTGTIIRIKKLVIRNIFRSNGGPDADVDQARIQLPSSDPVVVSGRLIRGVADFKVFCFRVDAPEAIRLFVTGGELLKVTGLVTELDIQIQKSITQPLVAGTFHADVLNYKGFSLEDVRGTFRVKVQDIAARKFKAEVNIASGAVRSRNTRVVLDPGRVVIADDPKNPILDLNGTSTIEKVKIRIAVKGTKQKPELHLSSEPSLPRETLLVMLATGRSWGGTARPDDQREVPQELATDFIDYFLFNGTGKKLADTFGLTDFSFQFDPGDKSIGLKKKITDQVKVGYQVDRKQPSPGAAGLSQTVGGELQVTDQLKIDVNRTFSQPSTQQNTTTETGTQKNDGIEIKYENRF